MWKRLLRLSKATLYFTAKSTEAQEEYMLFSSQWPIEPDLEGNSPESLFQSYAAYVIILSSLLDY